MWDGITPGCLDCVAPGVTEAVMPGAILDPVDCLLVWGCWFFWNTTLLVSLLGLMDWDGGRSSVCVPLSCVFLPPGSVLSLRRAVMYFLAGLCLLLLVPWCWVLPPEPECALVGLGCCSFNSCEATILLGSVFDRLCFTIGVEVGCKYFSAPGNFTSTEGFVLPAGQI